MTDEFAWLPELAAALPDSPPVPAVRREDRSVDGRTVSGLVWGHGAPDVVLLHGGAQNAHTWDSVLLALQRPAVAVDLPGHGHSAWREDLDYTPTTNATAIAQYLDDFIGAPVVLVGMSLGGLTATAFAVDHPDLVRHLVIVDVTPDAGRRVSAMSAQNRGTLALLDVADGFTSFDELLDAATSAVSGRNRESLRRGLWHNAVQSADGRWRWRADQRHPGETWEPPDHSHLWPLFDRLTVPTSLVLAAGSGIVAAEDEAQFQRRVPHAEILRIDTRNHSVQSSRPVELASVIARVSA